MGPIATAEIGVKSVSHFIESSFTANLAGRRSGDKYKLPFPHFPDSAAAATEEAVRSPPPPKLLVFRFIRLVRDPDSGAAVSPAAGLA